MCARSGPAAGSHTPGSSRTDTEAAPADFAEQQSCYTSGPCVTMETVHRGEWWGAPEHVCGQGSVSSLQEGSEQRFGFPALADKRPVKTQHEAPESFEGPSVLGCLGTLSMAVRAVG